MFALILTLLFIRPFISSPAYSYASYFFSVILLSVLLSTLAVKKKFLPPGLFLRYSLFFFAAAFIMSLFRSGNFYVGTHICTIFAAGIMLFLYSGSLSQEHKEQTVKLLVYSGLTISICAVYQYFFGFKDVLDYLARNPGEASKQTMEILQRKRVFFPFVTPNALGGFLAIIIPLALGIKGKEWLSIPLGIALIMTKSIGALIALSAGLILFACITGQKHKKLRIVIVLLGLTVIGVFTARSIFSQVNSTPEFSTLMRLSYWNDTLEIIKKHPFLGIGPGNFDLTQTRYAHNTYLQIWAESGIFEITAFICLVAAIIRTALTSVKNSAFKRQPAGILAACVVFLLHNLFDFTFFLPEISFIWWAIAGLNFTSSTDH